MPNFKELNSVTDVLNSGVETSRASLYRHIEKGMFPPPDLRCGSRPQWLRTTLERVVEQRMKAYREELLGPE